MIPFPTEPMLAKNTPSLPEKTEGGAFYEAKFDGIRALVFVEENRTRIQSRDGEDISASFPEIVTAAVAQVAAGVVLDGELVIWSHGEPDFPAVQARLDSKRGAKGRPACLMVFDLLAYGGDDVRGLPLTERHQLLDTVLAQAQPPLKRVVHTEDVEVARAWLADYTGPEFGCEGVVVKPQAGTYRPGRRPGGWLKFRARHTYDVVVGATIGAVTSPARLVVGYYRDGQLKPAGTTTTLDDQQRGRLGSVLRAALAKAHHWPEVMGPSRLWNRGGGPQRVTLVEPDQVVEVCTDVALEDGRWRRLVRFIRTRPDVEASTVTEPGQETET